MIKFPAKFLMIFFKIRLSVTFPIKILLKLTVKFAMLLPLKFPMISYKIISCETSNYILLRGHGFFKNLVY